MFKKFSVAAFAALLLAIPAFGQCPTVKVTGPSTDMKAGDPATFTVNVSGGDTRVSPTYNWSVSGGIIESGQGTSVIQLDTSGQDGQSITASVDVGGYMRSCSTFESWTISITAKAQTRKYDEFNYLGPAKLEYARLDDLAITLLNEPASNVHIIFYNGRKGAAGAINAWTTQTVGRLVKKGVAKTRVSTMDGGYRENGMMDIYIVPIGGDTPYAIPTVDPSEIKPATKPETKKVKSRRV